MKLSLPTLAFDIGTSSIKVLRLDRHGKNTFDIRLHLPTPEGSLQDGVIQDYGKLQPFLHEHIHKLPIYPHFNRATLALGENSVIIKRIYCPEQKVEDLAETLLFEAEQHFQHDIDELYFDYFLQPELKKDNLIPAVLVGAKKNIVEQYVSLIRSLGLKINAVECSGFSLINTMEAMALPRIGLTLLLHIGASSTQVILLENASYVYNRLIPIAGNECTRHLATQLKIPFQEAEQKKKDGAFDVAFMQPVYESIFHEIRMSLSFYFESKEMKGETRIQSIYLSGGSSAIKGLEQAFSEFFSLPVQGIDPFSTFSSLKNTRVPEESTNHRSFSIATGLAIRPSFFTIG